MKNGKMKINLGIRMCLLLAGISVLTACSSSKNSSHEMLSMEKELGAYVEEAAMDMVNQTAVAMSGSYNPETAPVDIGKKLIKTVNISLETKDMDTLLEQLDIHIKDNRGYIEYSNVSGDSSKMEHQRNASLTIRIPAEQLDVFIVSTKGAATVTNISNSTVDVTLSYVDTESRKKALEIEQERLYEILEKANTVEELITVEERLSQVRYDLEWYVSSLKSYDSQIDYSTVEVYIKEVERISRVEEQGMWSQIAIRFGDSISNLIKGAKIFFIWFIGGIPYFIILGGFTTIGIVILKKRKKRK
jgi:hypothetical protein